MVPPFDIFKVVDGHLVWVEAIPRLDAAKARVTELIAERPMTYLIFSHITGNKIVLKPGEPTWSQVNPAMDL